MKDYRRRRTGATRTQAGPATINGSTFGNHIRIIQGNLNIFRPWRKPDSSPDNQPSETDPVQLEEKEKTDCRRSLVFRDIDARLHDISPVQPGTCDWVFGMPLFQKWYDHSEPDNGLLWIKGNPGTGKSTLIKHIFQYCQAEEKYVIAAYFFNARGAKLEQTPLGMLRSLLFQLLNNTPCLYDQFLPMFRKKRQECVSDDWEWYEPELKSFCLSEIPKCQPGPLLLIIDALDECSEADMQNVAEFLQDLRNNAADAGLTLKICLSSRHYPFIRFTAYQELVLEKEKQHKEDIIKYISSNFTHKDEEIEESIRKKSSGIFMWVVLVISMLNRAYEDGKIEGMKERLNKIPTALGEVFAMMLEKNNPDKDETILILQCVLFAKRPLTPEEMYFAIIAGTKSRELGRWDPLKITPEIIRRRIISSSRGLVEIRKRERNETTHFGQTFLNDIEDPKSKQRMIPKEKKTRDGKEEIVQFIHETVSDFLVHGHRLQRLDPGLMPDPVAKSHDRLKDCCMSYLMMQSLKQKNIARMESSFPFLEYASSYLFDHAEEATSESQAELVRALKDDDIFKPVERFHKYFIYYGQGDEPLTLLDILAVRELPKLVGILADEGVNINAKRGPHWTALGVAIAFGSEETVKTLLSKGAKVDAHRIRWADSTLSWSFLNHNKEILAMLIDRGATLSILDRIVGRSVLHYAVETGDKDIITMILDKGTKVNALGLTSSALLYATKNGHTEIVKLLLEKGANVHSRGFFGSALIYAIVDGHTEIVKLLLEKGANIKSRGLFGSSLIHAAFNKNIEIVKLLLEKGANIHSRGLLGSPLVFAAFAGNKETVNLLLEKGANLNTGRWFSGNALHTAAMRGNKDIVEMLLEKGANINARELIGSAYVFTEGADNVDKTRIPEMLLKRGIKTSAWGKVYGTALQAAAAKGREEIVQLLLDRGAKR